MDRNEIISQVLNKKIRDYTFPVLFFIMFSIFVFFAIRPNLVTAFSLQRQLEELRQQDAQYETIILNIVRYQSVVEQTRDDIGVLEEAVPTSPQIFSMVEGLRNAATQSGMIINNMDVSDVQLKGELEDEATSKITKKVEEENKKFVIKFQATSSFNDVRNFLAQIANQRRLKIIESMNVNAVSNQGSGSATFNISFVINGFYL